MPYQHEPIVSRAAIAGHPLHPLLVHFPVASLIGLLGADLAFLYTLDPFWDRVGLWLAGTGALGGSVAAVPGMIDLFTVRHIRRLINGWCHALVAVMMLSLASLNWLLRWNEPSDIILPWGLLLTLTTAVMIALTGYLGGRLVYEHAVGVDIPPG